MTNAKEEALSGSIAVSPLSPSFSHSYVHQSGARGSGTDTFDYDGVNVKRIVISGSIHVATCSATATAVLNDGTRVTLGGYSCGWISGQYTSNSGSVTLYPDEKLTMAQMNDIRCIEFNWSCNNTDVSGNATSSLSIVLYGNTIHWE